jgi:predicted  nucleic acid-binding Zn-ribbon protein
METQEILSQSTGRLTAESVETEQSENVKLVPVAESIRYRKRAQNAEKQIENLSEQLARAQEQTAQLSGQLSDIQTEQKLMHKLIAAGAVDIESAVLLARARMKEDADSDPDDVIEQLKKEKQFLFGGTETSVTAAKTAGAKERSTNVHTILERAAKKAATTGNRADLHEYLKLRRNYL